MIFGGSRLTEKLLKSENHLRQKEKEKKKSKEEEEEERKKERKKISAVTATIGLKSTSRKKGRSRRVTDRKKTTQDVADGKLYIEEEEEAEVRRSSDNGDVKINL
ncbi:hypothetical protein RUM43_005625 [Polyplax serrata]|uniref:Uncharacterized protein n=1 Tax=Polyplax serrata TaxID=468196 RepID=A0AAN8S1M1_POLSC